MKFNYFREAKENGHDGVSFKFANTIKNEYGDSRYMAAHWLAWAYTFLQIGDKEYTRSNIRAFLQEIARICDE